MAFANKAVKLVDLRDVCNLSLQVFHDLVNFNWEPATMASIFLFIFCTYLVSQLYFYVMAPEWIAHFFH